MEWLENNILKEKLEQLDTLPEGYTPSLDSKFELLMAATSAPAKRVSRLYYLIPASAAAAVVVMFFYFSGVEQKVEYAAHYYSGHQLAEPAVVNTHIQQSETVAQVQKKQRIRKRLRTKTAPAAEVKVAFLGNEHMANTPVVEEQNTTLVAIENTPKKEKKVRYTEVDFDDKPIHVASAEPAHTPKQRVAFRFSIFNTTAGTSTNTPPLLLKQNF